MDRGALTIEIDRVQLDPGLPDALRGGAKQAGAIRSPGALARVPGEQIRADHVEVAPGGRALQFMHDFTYLARRPRGRLRLLVAAD